MPKTLPPAPFHQPGRPQDQDLRDEIRLCLGTVVGCLVIGGAGWFYRRLNGGETHLTAFLVVAGFYGIMALNRIIKLMMGVRSAGSGGH